MQPSVATESTLNGKDGGCLVILLWTHKNQYIERLGFLVDEMLDLRGSNFHTPRIISPHFRQIVSFCFSHEQYKNLNFMFIIVNMTTGSHVVTQKTIFAIIKVTKLIQFYIVANHSNSCIKANKRPYSNTETGNSGEEKLCFNRKKLPYTPFWLFTCYTAPNYENQGKGGATICCYQMGGEQWENQN